MRIVIASLIFSLLLTNFAYSASEILLKSDTDVKYKNLLVCIKDNNNDISFCIEHFTSYLQAEKKLLSLAENNEKYKDRLVKMIDYLKKSTDIFVAKAEKSNEPSDWSKAAKCGSLLSKLSAKYSSYKDISTRYKTAQKASSASSALEVLLSEISKIPSPDGDYVEKFKKYTDYVSKAYANLPSSLQQESTQYAQLKINQYIENILDKSKKYLAEQNVSFEDAYFWHSTYNIATKMPGVESKKLEEENIRTAICNKIPDYVELRNKADEIINSGLELYLNNSVEKLGVVIANGNAVLGTAEMGLIGASYLRKSCSSIPSDSSPQVKHLRDSLTFLKNVHAGYLFENKNDLKSSEISYYQALKVNSVRNDVFNLAQKRHTKILAALVKNIKHEVLESIKNETPYDQILTQLDRNILNSSGDPSYPKQLFEIQRSVVAEWGTAVRTGKKKVESIQDVIVAYKPSTNKLMLINPPLDGPKDDTQFYAWPCKLDQKSNLGYVCWDTKWIFEGGDIEGFIFDDVKRNFSDLQFNTTVLVIGRYVKNTDVTMILGKVRPIPYLTESYVFPLNFSGYSWKKLEKLF